MQLSTSGSQPEHKSTLEDKFVANSEPKWPVKTHSLGKLMPVKNRSTFAIPSEDPV